MDAVRGGHKSKRVVQGHLVKRVHVSPVVRQTLIVKTEKSVIKESVQSGALRTANVLQVIAVSIKNVLCLVHLTHNVCIHMGLHVRRDSAKRPLFHAPVVRSVLGVTYVVHRSAVRTVVRPVLIARNCIIVIRAHAR